MPLNVFRCLQAWFAAASRPFPAADIRGVPRLPMLPEIRMGAKLGAAQLLSCQDIRNACGELPVLEALLMSAPSSSNFFTLSSCLSTWAVCLARVFGVALQNAPWAKILLSVSTRSVTGGAIERAVAQAERPKYHSRYLPRNIAFWSQRQPKRQSICAVQGRYQSPSTAHGSARWEAAQARPGSKLLVKVHSRDAQCAAHGLSAQKREGFARLDLRGKRNTFARSGKIPGRRSTFAR